MKYLKKTLLVAFILQSCSGQKSQIEELQSMLKECDEVVVVLDNRVNNSNTSIKVKDTAGINIFTELITGKKEKVDDNCDPIGDLLYKKEGKIFFTAEFSVPIEALNNNCLYVRYNLYPDTFRHRFTYRAGQLLTGLKYQKIPQENSESNKVE